MAWGFIADLRRRLEQAERRLAAIEERARSYRNAKRGDDAAAKVLASYERDRRAAESDVAWLKHQLAEAEEPA